MREPAFSDRSQCYFFQVAFTGVSLPSSTEVAEISRECFSARPSLNESRDTLINSSARDVIN